MFACACKASALIEKTDRAYFDSYLTGCTALQHHRAGQSQNITISPEIERVQAADGPAKQGGNVVCYRV